MSQSTNNVINHKGKYPGVTQKKKTACDPLGNIPLVYPIKEGVTDEEGYRVLARVLTLTCLP